MKRNLLIKKFFVVIVAFLINCVATPYITAFADEPRPVIINRTVNIETTEVGEKFTITYQITGDEIKLPRTKKEIAVVIDRSGSMAWDVYGNPNPPQNKSRMYIAREAAKKFVSYSDFQNAFTKIFIVPYSSYVGYQVPISDIKRMDQAESLDYLKNFISGLNAYGGTNTGDAFRVSYNMLKNGESIAKKYIVMLTDGDPTFYTYNDSNNNGSFNPPAETYYTGTALVGSSQTIKANNSNDFARGLEYALDRARYINDNSEDGKYNSFIIGFAQDVNQDKLEQLGTAVGALPVPSNGNRHYYKALTADDLEEAYEAIKDIMSDTIPFSLMHFSETLPAGVVIDPQILEERDGAKYIKNTNLKVSTITANGANRVQISGPLSAVLKKVRSEPDGEVFKIDDTSLSFSIQVVATVDGELQFEKNTAKIDYVYQNPDGTNSSGTAYNGNEHRVTVSLRNSNLVLNDIVLLKGSSVDLTAFFDGYPDNKISSWSVSQSGNIISLADNGNGKSARITALDEGSAEITASTQSSSGWYKVELDTCKVNVIDVEIENSIYVLNGCTVPLKMKVFNSSGSNISINVSAGVSNTDEVSLTITNSSVSGTLSGEIGIGEIKGLKVPNGNTAVTLTINVTVSGQNKTLTSNIYVVDAEITPSRYDRSEPDTLMVDLWGKEEYFTIVKKAPDETTKNDILLSTPVFVPANGGGYINFDGTSWRVKGVKLSDSPIEMTVEITFNGQSKTVVRKIKVKDFAPDLN